MRARNIKPAIFKNELLARLGPWHFILFQGLWCLADREGRLEDRPDRIEAEIFPFKFQQVDIEKLLNDLQNDEKNSFILRYSKNKNRYIQITSFNKHQRPHPNEDESTIPPLYLGRKHLQPRLEAHGLNPDVLNPDVLNPDVLNPDSIDIPRPPNDAFEQTWTRYPGKTGSKLARRHFTASVKTLADFLDIQKALENYLKSKRVTEGFIQNGSTWFNNWRDWINYTEDVNAQSNSRGGAYIGAQASVGKYATITQNGKDPKGDSIVP